MIIKHQQFYSPLPVTAWLGDVSCCMTIYAILPLLWNLCEQPFVSSNPISIYFVTNDSREHFLQLALRQLSSMPPSSVLIKLDWLANCLHSFIPSAVKPLRLAASVYIYIYDYISKAVRTVIKLIRHAVLHICYIAWILTARYITLKLAVIWSW